MPSWVNNREAAYVFAAYGVAAAILLGLLLISWIAGRKRKAEWLGIKDRQKPVDC